MNTQYATFGCQNTKHEPLPPARVTDRTMIDVRSAANHHTRDLRLPS